MCTVCFLAIRTKTGIFPPVGESTASVPVPAGWHSAHIPSLRWLFQTRLITFYSSCLRMFVHPLFSFHLVGFDSANLDKPSGCETPQKPSFPSRSLGQSAMGNQVLALDV